MSHPFKDKRLEEAVLMSLSLLVKRKATAKDLTPENLSKLDFLDYTDLEIENLEGIEQLTGLTYIHLDGNPIKDITPLTMCSHLKYVSLCSTMVKDLSPVLAMMKLEQMNFGKNLQMYQPEVEAISSTTGVYIH